MGHVFPAFPQSVVSRKARFPWQRRRTGFILIWGRRSENVRDPSVAPFRAVCPRCNQTSNIPYELPEEYDVDMDFTRVSGDEDVDLVLSAGHSNFLFMTGAWHNSVFGVDAIRRVRAIDVHQTVRGHDMVTLQGTHHLKVLVRKNDFEALLDGQYDYRTTPNYADWHVDPEWREAVPLPFGLITQNSTTTIVSLRVTPLH